MSARLFDNTPRALGVSMNDRDQLASRKGSRTIKNKPTTTTAPNSLNPQRPTPRTNRTVSPPKTGNDGQATGDYRQTTRPAPMPQRINARTRETIYPIRHSDPPPTQSTHRQQEAPTREHPTKSHSRTNPRRNDTRLSCRHQPSTNTNRHGRTKSPRRLALILAPMK